MPAYFSMTLHFDRKRIRPNFAKELYSIIMQNGFDFSNGYCSHKKAKLDEIIEWNQERLEKGFQLGHTQHVKHDYVQVLFKSDLYSELRGYWLNFDDEIIFNLIIPENDILNTEGGDYFIPEKIEPMKNLALKLWDNNVVDVISTTVELADGDNLPDILSGKNIAFIPFAILPEIIYLKFSKNYFRQAKATKIKNNGIFIETDGKINIHL